ncbi:MAG: NYN domain-containing protein [candidate division WOR-3 bacterium]|nr:MAG: NYN domain-containing protein [candidate division WOR-3 bacterium]
MNDDDRKTEQYGEIKEEIHRQTEEFFQKMNVNLQSYLAATNEIFTRLREEIRELKQLIESSNLVKKETVAIFVDSQNLYYSARMGYAAKVSYEKLLRLITGNRKLIKAYAYIVQPPEGDVKPFATSLERIGYIVKAKDVRTRANGSAKANWDMGIALDILGILDRVDTIVLASGDGDFVPLVDLIKGKNKRVEIFAFPDNTAYDLKEKADRFEPLGENVILT